MKRRLTQYFYFKRKNTKLRKKKVYKMPNGGVGSVEGCAVKKWEGGTDGGVETWDYLWSNMCIRLCGWFLLDGFLLVPLFERMSYSNRI
jgi:hypothetical protein